MDTQFRADRVSGRAARELRRHTNAGPLQSTVLAGSGERDLCLQVMGSERPPEDHV
jgi:hypothetical protein